MILLFSPTNLAAEKLTAFILCSARKKLANLLTFAVLNHSIQVYLSAFKRIRELDIWNWTQFIECFYLLTWSKTWFLASELACFLTYSLVPRWPRTIFKTILIRDRSSITSSKRWVGGVRKVQFLMIYSTVNHQRVGWVGLKKSKTWWRNTWMVPY